MAARPSDAPVPEWLPDPPRGAGPVVLALLVVGALVFSNAYAARRVAMDGLVAQRAEATLAAADLTASSLTHAVLRATARRPGLEEATDEARKGLLETSRRGGELQAVLESTDPALEEALGEFRSSGEAVLAALEEGRRAQAGRLLETEFAQAHRTLVGRLAVVRDRHAAMLAAAREPAGAVANLARLGLGIALPGLVILGYRWLVGWRVGRVRRRVEERWEEARRLAAAREELVADLNEELQEALYGSYRLTQRLVERGVMSAEEAAQLTAAMIGRSEEVARRAETLAAAGRAATGRLELVGEELDFREELEAVLAGGDRIEVTCPPAKVRADRQALRLVLRNLLAEARRPGGGVSVKGTLGGGELVCTVVGRQGEEPSAPSEGGDLGLEVSRRLLEQMGGGLSQERHVEETRFVLRLRGRAAERPREAEAQRPPGPAAVAEEARR